jgi:geranylgeranyl diphosphate synthase type II
MASRRAVIEEALGAYMPGEDLYPRSLHRAMRYSVFSGGKRFRPLLCIAAFEACGGEDTDRVMPVSCALEIIHTYSLIHDDLPCMDDDDVRRGRPTNHRVFGEATAVLAGDALLTFAVDLLASRAAEVLEPERVLRVLGDVLAAIGTRGMVAGQVVDMESEGREPDGDVVRYIHSRKSGALIRASARVGALAAAAREDEVAAISTYGEKIGLAFQIVDDILDVEGSFGDLKAGGDLDSRQEKMTYPRVFGLAGARSDARDLVEEARTALAGFDDRADALRALAGLVISRTF